MIEGSEKAANAPSTRRSRSFDPCEWATDEARTTLVILVQGTFRVEPSVGSVTLQRQGDYVTWGPGIDHTWRANADSTVITVRWSSLTDC